MESKVWEDVCRHQRFYLSLVRRKFASKVIYRNSITQCVAEVLSLQHIEFLWIIIQ